MEKLNLTHKSTHSPIKTNVLRHKINTKKLQTTTRNLFRQQNFYVNAQGAHNYCEPHT